MDFTPVKYYKGLSQKEKAQRKREFENKKGSEDYTPLKTDKGKTTKQSRFTLEWKKSFPNVKGKEQISKLTHIPVSILDEVYDRGLEAWKTGHRPGATQHAWAWARLYSFLLKGCTYYKADADLVRKAKKIPEVKAYYSTRKCMCGKYCPDEEN